MKKILTSTSKLPEVKFFLLLFFLIPNDPLLSQVVSELIVFSKMSSSVCEKSNNFGENWANDSLCLSKSDLIYGEIYLPAGSAQLHILMLEIVAENVCVCCGAEREREWECMCACLGNEKEREGKESCKIDGKQEELI